MTDAPKPELTLDPADWPALRAEAHKMLDAALDKLESAREGRVWTLPPDHIVADLETSVPAEGISAARTREKLEALLPYGVGNTHPRFFGWVNGSGTPSGLMAEIAAAAINANTGGRNHAAIKVEKQVIAWCAQIMGFPNTSSGLVVTGTSMATIIAMKAARDQALNYYSRTDGICGGGLVGYTSEQTHSCIARAFDMIGIGSGALRKLPTNDAFQLDTDALKRAIAEDRAAGLDPFAIIATAGTVNTGAIDDLDTIADIAKDESIWFHVDGAFGAMGMLSDEIRPRLKGLERADSVAFDFHKWMHVNYDAGFVLIRSEEAHRRAFSLRPAYLKGTERGLAAGNPWPTEYGPELSRGFRALKVWAQLTEHGTEKLGALVAQNCDQAVYLAEKVDAHDALERLAPVSLNICCFRFTAPGLSPDRLNDLNDEIVIQLQIMGIAAPSTTRLHGNTAIRVNLTNHRTRRADLDLLVDEIARLGRTLSTVEMI